MRLHTLESVVNLCWKTAIGFSGIGIDRNLAKCVVYPSKIKEIDNYDNDRKKHATETIGLKWIESHTEYTSGWRIGNFATYAM